MPRYRQPTRRSHHMFATAVPFQPHTSAPGVRVLVVANRASGSAAALAAVDLLRQRLSEQGRRVDELALVAGRVEEMLRAALSGVTYQAIYVAGGDGTVLAVVEALAGRSVPIAIIPCGTMNWTARDLGIPLDPEAAIDALRDAEVRHIDLGRVNGKPFLCACMVGFGSLLARWRERERARGNSPWVLWPKLVWRGLSLIQRYRHLRLRLRTAERHERLRARALVVTANLIDDRPGPVPRRPRLDAGQLGLYAVRDASGVELMRLGMRLMLGTWQQDDALLATSASHAEIGVGRRRAVSVMCDGERVRLRTPLRFTLERATVAVLVPRAGRPTV
ncbi:diacylglycerol kinase [Marichromatium sp. AB31]|nr:diacylglycerol kinase [Marichromatium sp. AB31]